MISARGSRNVASIRSGLVAVLIATVSCSVLPAQSPGSKPLLIIKVENEGDNLTRPAEVTNVTSEELSTLRSDLNRQLGAVFTIIPESDERDCIELGVSIEKVTTPHGLLYLASSAIAVGKGKNDLLLTHNVVAQPSLQKVTAALNYQLSVMVLQAQLGNIGK